MFRYRFNQDLVFRYRFNQDLVFRYRFTQVLVFRYRFNQVQPGPGVQVQVQPGPGVQVQVPCLGSLPGLGYTLAFPCSVEACTWDPGLIVRRWSRLQRDQISATM